MRILPPPLQKPVYLKGVYYNRDEKSKNSNIQQQLAMKFYGKNLSHARVLLNHLEKSGVVEWNEYGDISQPINGYNIIKFMEDVIVKDKINPNKVEDYKFIIHSSNLPLSVIKNQELKDHLTQYPPSTVISRKGKLFRQAPRWNSF